MTRNEWIEHGAKQGWCTYIRCATHDGPINNEEYDYDDPCFFVLEILNDD